MTHLQSSSVREPVIPIEMRRPRHPQHLTEQQAHRIDVLGESPIRQPGVTRKLFKPLRDVSGGPVTKTSLGMAVDQRLHMLSIPGQRFSRHAKLLREREIMFTELRHPWVGCGIARLNERLTSLFG